MKHRSLTQHWRRTCASTALAVAISGAVGTAYSTQQCEDEYYQCLYDCTVKYNYCVSGPPAACEPQRDEQLWYCATDRGSCMLTCQNSGSPVECEEACTGVYDNCVAAVEAAYQACIYPCNVNYQMCDMECGVRFLDCS